MSIKRSKQRSGGFRRDGDDDLPSFMKRPEPEPEKSWEESVAGQPDEAFTPYALSSRFAKGALVAHAKFGRGIVTAVEGSHIEVLFQEGKKKLGHGAQPRPET